MILQGEIVLSNVNDGAPGQNVVRLDLDNEADTWLTRSNGEDITTSLTSRGRLYDGTKQVTSGFTKELVCEGCEGAVTATSLNPGLMTINVTKVSAEHASATLKVTYKGALYSAVFSVTKSADGGRYVLDVSPSAVQAGTDKTTSPGRLSVSAYYETASGERKKLKPGTDCKIYADGTEVKGSDSTGYIGYYTIPAGASSVSLQLKNIDGVVLDHETVPVLYDGQSASDVRMQYATSADGPWQDSYADGCKWFRVSTDGGKTWGVAMKFIGDKGEPGVNPACYRLIQDGNGMCTAGLVLGTDASGKPTVSVEMAIDLSFSIYKFVGDSAERLGSSKDFAAESVFVPAGKATYGGITLETVNTGDGFDVGCDDTVSETDIVNTLIDMSAVKVTLKQGGKVWDTVTVPVTTAQDQAYSRTKAMMESIYTNKENFSVYKQQADNISEMVYSHGRNLLYDAGFTDSTPTLEGTMGQRRFQTSAGNTVTVNGDGTLTITASGNVTAQYSGVYWYVPIQATGYYTASVEVLDGTTVTDDSPGSFAIYTATEDRTQEQNMIGYNSISASNAGKRVSVTTNTELTGADFAKYLEVFVVVPTNGTIKIKCPQLERGKEATNWTLRGTEDGLMKAGLDIETGKANLYADRTTIYNSKGKEIAVFDSDGNLLAGSLTCTKDGLTANIVPGLASFLKYGTKMGIRIGIIDGLPALYATNETGDVVWKMGIDYKTSTSDTAALSGLTGDGYAAYLYSASLADHKKTGIKVVAEGTITITNTSTVMHTYDENNISIKVDNLWGTDAKDEDCNVALGNASGVGAGADGSISFDIEATTSSTDTTNFPSSPWQATVHVLYLGNEIGSGKVPMSPDFS